MISDQALRIIVPIVVLYVGLLISRERRATTS